MVMLIPGFRRRGRCWEIFGGPSIRECDVIKRMIMTSQWSHPSGSKRIPGEQGAYNRRCIPHAEMSVGGPRFEI